MLVITGDKSGTFLKRTRLILRALKLEYKEVDKMPNPKSKPGSSDTSKEVMELTEKLEQMTAENKELKVVISGLTTKPTEAEIETKGDVANVTGKPDRDTKQDKTADDLTKK